MKSFHADFCARNRSRYFLIAGLGGSGSANFVVKPTFDFTVGGLFLLYRLSAILGFSTGLEDTV
jgi:hypothetical protein